MNIFESNILNVYGDKGKAWLTQLPHLVADISSRLGLRELTPVPNLTYNYVLSGFQGDFPVVLKLGLDSEGLKTEAFSLKCFEGFGAVKVLIDEKGLVLLERPIPGSSLKSEFPNKDIDATQISCKIMKKLHKAGIPAVHNFPHIRDWLATLDKDWEIPPNYLQKARKLRDQLLAASGPDILLHGDLHHDNILKNGDDASRQRFSEGEWLVIDPKGVIGSPINEVSAFVMDMERDIPFIAQYFGFKVQDVFDWYFVHLILSICWTLEDNVDSHLFLELAEKAHRFV